MGIERPPTSLGVLDSKFNQFVFFDGELKRLTKKYNAEYAYWSKIKHIPLPLDYTPLDFWSAIKMIRHSNYQAIMMGNTQFNYWVTSQIQNSLHQLDMSSGGIQKLSSILNGSDRNRYIQSSFMEEAISSSIIEGAVTTRIAAKDMLQKGKRPTNNSERMIANNFQAMGFIKKYKNEPLTLELLFNLHKILTTGTLKVEEEVGRFRRTEDNIVIVNAQNEEIVYFPPSALEIPQQISWLLNFFNNQDDETDSGQTDFIHPIVKASIIHFLVAYIHPFVDGNGRIARTLFYWYLLSNGYWLAEHLAISSIIATRKNRYYDAFLHTEYDNNDLTYFIHFQIDILHEAFSDLKKYLNHQSKENQDGLLKIMVESGLSQRQALLYIKLKEEGGIWTVHQAETALAVSHQTARNDLNVLTEKGLTDRIALDKKTQGWTIKTIF